MAQSVITSAFERLKAREAAGGNRIIIDQFIFANIPGLDANATPPANEEIPPDAQIVHRQSVDLNGMVNENTVAYSVLLPEFLGNFSFNWLGMVSCATNTLCQVIYLFPQKKLKTTNGRQGNTLIYSEIMEYAGASAATGITTPVSTWQIDFTARLHGMDEATRKAALDIYGPGLFFDDAFKLTATATGQASFAPGIAYLRGLRVELDAPGTLTFATGKAQTVYIDAVLTGTLTGENKATFSLTSKQNTDYVDSLNQMHYVEPVATISASGVITDIRKTRKRLTDRLDGEFLAKEKNLSDLPNIPLALSNLTLADVKKAVEQTHLGLSKLPQFRPATEDDLTSLPAGYMVLSKNATPGGPLPDENWHYLEVAGKIDNPLNNLRRKGAAIRLTQVSNPKISWTGAKFDDGSTTTEKFAWTRDFNTLNPPTPTDVGALDKNQNGKDIPDKDLFVRNTGAARAFSAGVSIGGDAGVWTTADFIAWLENQGAFNHPYWMCKGSWDYSGNKIITDTGCGNIQLAGAAIEVMGLRGAMTIRITTPTTTTNGTGSAQFTYINHGPEYAPGWRRDYNTTIKPTAEDTGALPLTGGVLSGNLFLKSDARMHFAIVNEDGNVRMWLYKDKGGDGIRINNGIDGGGEFVFGKDSQFYSPGDVRAGSARFSAGDGNIAGSLWGGWLSTWLNNQFAARDNAINARATKNSGYLANTGWFKDSSTGLILQWGEVGRTGYGTWVNFPIAFTSFCSGVFLTLSDSPARLDYSSNNIHANSRTLSGFNYAANTAESSAFWLAIGG